MAKLSVVKDLEKKYLSLEELAKYLGQTRRWVRDNIKNDPTIPMYMIQKQPIWKVADIDHAIEAQRC